MPRREGCRELSKKREKEAGKLSINQSYKKKWVKDRAYLRTYHYFLSGIVKDATKEIRPKGGKSGWSIYQF